MGLCGGEAMWRWGYVEVRLCEGEAMWRCRHQQYYTSVHFHIIQCTV